MAERKAEQWEKDLIRDEIERAAARGATMQEIANIRVALSKSTGLSLPQIGSISAWKRSSDGSAYVLKPTESELKKVQESIANEELELEVNKLLHLQIIRDHYNFSHAIGRPIERIRFEILKIFKNFYSSDETIELLQLAQKRYKTDSEIVVLDDNFAKPGERVNYDNEAKNKSRDWWLNYLWEATKNEDKSKMNLVLLPGPECHELSPVISMGFSPENLRCYNLGKDPAASSTFIKNCQEQGVFGWRLGDLVEALPLEAERIHGGNLDFTGFYSEKVEKILGYLPIPKNGTTYFNINLEKKRERSKITSIYRSVAAITQHAKESVRAAMAYGLPQIGLKESLREQNKQAIKAKNDLSINTSEARKEALEIIIEENLGIGRSENWICFDEMRKIVLSSGRYPDFDSFDDFKKATSAMDVLHSYEDGFIVELQNALKNNSIFRLTNNQIEAIPMIAMSIMHKGSFNQTSVMQCKKFEYVSPTGSPFISHFLICENRFQAYKAMDKTIKFLYNSLNSYIKGLSFYNPKEVVEKMRKNEPTGELIKYQSGGFFRLQGDSTKCDLVFYNKDPKLTATIHFKNFQSDLIRMEILLKEYYANAERNSEFNEMLKTVQNEPQSCDNNLRPKAQKSPTHTLSHGQIIKIETRIGRNDFCICKSGKKFKNCCGKK